MVNVVGVRFRTAGKIYYFDPCSFTFKKGDRVIVETARGVECGEVVAPNHEVADEDVVAPLKNVIRKADETISSMWKRTVTKWRLHICLEKIKKHNLT
jgi:cell fate regulator YaaT (PSP1 superfamily)